MRVERPVRMVAIAERVAVMDVAATVRFQSVASTDMPVVMVGEVMTVMATVVSPQIAVVAVASTVVVSIAEIEAAMAEMGRQVPLAH